jgi:hypothetical protein
VTVIAAGRRPPSRRTTRQVTMTVMPANRYHRERAEELLADIAADAHTEREVTAVVAGLR